MRSTLLLLVLALALGALATACSGGGGDSASDTTLGPGATTAPASAGCAPFAGVTTQLASHGDVAPGFLTDVNAEQVDCLDRVTFLFDSKGAVPPGYEVGYQDVNQDPITDCDGPITMAAGNAFLMVTIKPAASTNPFLPEGEQDTYKGNLRLSYGRTHHLEIVQKLCDGDGTVRWVIGLDSVRPFVVDRAVDPIRISVLIS